MTIKYMICCRDFVWDHVLENLPSSFPPRKKCSHDSSAASLTMVTRYTSRKLFNSQDPSYSLFADGLFLRRSQSNRRILSHQNTSTTYNPSHVSCLCIKAMLPFPYPLLSETAYYQD